jgi:hypothetical protein
VIRVRENDDTPPPVGPANLRHLRKYLSCVEVFAWNAILANHVRDRDIPGHGSSDLPLEYWRQTMLVVVLGSNTSECLVACAWAVAAKAE